MKCYTVVDGERFFDGIIIKRKEDGTLVCPVGSNNGAAELPVGKGVQRKFEENERNILRFREALERLDAGEESAESDLRKLAVEVNREDFLDFDYVGFARDWAKLDPNRYLLKKADLSTNQPWRLTLERGKSDTALVHVLIESTGQQEYYANSYDEELVECRHPFVRKEYHPFPSAGIGVAAPGVGPRGEPQGLLLMYPKSSFRVHRDEDPPAVVVAWPGSTLRCFVPAKHRPARKQKQRRRRGAA